jgi:hypothetical protein
MKWIWPLAETTPESKTVWPLALLSKPRAANWGARNSGSLIRDGQLRNAVGYRCTLSIGTRSPYL